MRKSKEREKIKQKQNLSIKIFNKKITVLCFGKEKISPDPLGAV